MIGRTMLVAVGWLGLTASMYGQGPSTPGMPQPSQSMPAYAYPQMPANGTPPGLYGGSPMNQAAALPFGGGLTGVPSTTAAPGFASASAPGLAGGAGPAGSPYRGSVGLTTMPNPSTGGRPTVASPLPFGQPGASEQSAAIPTSWLTSAWPIAPTWEVRAEVLWLHVDFPDSEPLAIQYQQVSPTTFAPRPIGAFHEAQYIFAPRVTAEYHQNECWSFDGAFMVLLGPDQQDSPLGVGDFSFYLNANFADPVTGTPLPDERGFITTQVTPFPLPSVADRLTLDWDSSTWSGEFNIWRHFKFPKGFISDFAVGGGFRYFGFYESVTIRAVDVVNATQGRIRVESENTLIGGQFTMRARANGPFRWMRWVSEGKFGLMSNGTENERVVVDTLGNEPLRQKTGRNQFAPLIEGNFYVEFFLNSHLTLYSGFHLLYADRIERASEQFYPDLDNDFISLRKDLSTLFIFGPRVGLQFTY